MKSAWLLGTRLAATAGLLWLGLSSARAGGPSGTLLIPEVDSDTVALIDGASNHVVGRFHVALPASRPAVMAPLPDGSKIYIDNFGLLPPSVTVLDLAHHSQHTVVVGATPLGAFTSDDGREIFLPENGHNVEVMDVATDTVVRTLTFKGLPVASIPGPGGLLYVGFQDGTVGAYDPASGAEIKPPVFTGGIAPFWYTFTPDGRKLYVDTVNSIGVVDVGSWKLTKIISTNRNGIYTANEPGAFTSILSPDGTKLYVSVFGDTGVRVYDLATDKLIGVIPTAGSVPAVIFSADGTRGYISDLGASTAAFTGPVGEVFAFLNLVTIGLLGNGQIIPFDPKTDQIVEAPIPVRAGPGIGAWVDGKVDIH